jgi:subtilase family serine protease
VSRRLALLAATCLVTSGLSAVALADPSASGLTHRNVHACAAASPGFAACDAIRHDTLDANGKPVRQPPFAGYTAANLQSAYNVASAAASAGGAQVVGIVDAYDDPNAAPDLSTYRSQQHLSPCAYGTPSTSCLRIVNQNGQSTSLPSPDAGWSQEISLDLDMVSAICPNCHILLVEANSNNFTDLAAAVDRAAIMGAKVISNSYGGPEFSSETSSTYNSHYNHPGVAITVSTGDSGYGVQFPASSQWVTAVGGTSLKTASNLRGWTETAWSGAGSGCSAYIGKPSWQTDGSCNQRTVADVSAVADPNTGVQVFDTYQASGNLVFGGTSAAAPIIGAVYALAGNASAVTQGSYPYSQTASLNDVTSGSNGRCSNRFSSSAAYLCTAGTGYDGPTGLGTPNGTGAF